MDEEELRAFEERIQRMLGREGEDIAYAFEPKLDGAGVELIYKKDAWFRASLAVTGKWAKTSARACEACTRSRCNSTRTVLARPRWRRSAARSSCPWRAFGRLNELRVENGVEPLANPRNAAAGSLRQLHDIDMRRLKSLEFHAYHLAEGIPDGVATQTEILEVLRAWGLVVNPDSRPCQNLDAALDAHRALLARREALPIEADGTVVKVDRLSLQDELGTLSRAPRWAIAVKFPPQQAETRVNAIIINVGRTGALTPVAQVEPVQVGGVTVSNISLHNRDEIERKDLRVGDAVIIQRAGDVIPQVVRTLAEKRKGRPRKFKFPQRCPVCDSEAIRLEDEVVTRCPNIDCPAQLKNNLIHLAARGALDIDGMGEKMVEQLVEAGHVEASLRPLRARPSDARIA